MSKLVIQKMAKQRKVDENHEKIVLHQCNFGKWYYSAFNVIKYFELFYMISEIQ